MKVTINDCSNAAEDFAATILIRTTDKLVFCNDVNNQQQKDLEILLQYINLRTQCKLLDLIDDERNSQYTQVKVGLYSFVEPDVIAKDIDAVMLPSGFVVHVGDNLEVELYATR